MKEPIILTSEEPIDIEKHLETIQQRAELPKPEFVDYVGISKKMSWILFGVGLLLMLCMLFPNPFPLRNISFFFVRFFFVINCLLGAYLLLSLFFCSKEKKKAILKAIVIVLCNIPLTFFYAIFFLYFLSHVRFHIVNDTGKTLTDINVSHCEPNYIANLAPLERSQTIWLDCYHYSNSYQSIHVNYKKDNLKTEEQTLSIKPLIDIDYRVYRLKTDTIIRYFAYSWEDFSYSLEDLRSK